MNWFLDWDGTVTTTDTLSIVASIGYRKNRNENLLPWSHFSEAYRSDYESHAARHKPNENSGISFEQFFAWQESLVEVERASLERVERSGMFANLREREVDEAARRAVASQTVVFRPGLGTLLDIIRTRDGRITIVSVNWSRRFIYSCLQSTTELQHHRKLENITIRANEIEFGSSGRLSRAFEKEDRGIWTAGDKARVMGEEVKAGPEQRPSIYVGDSSSDLQCLLLADLGICVRDDKPGSEQQSLQEILAWLDIPCHWIGDYHTVKNDGVGRHLWWARDFQEISNSGLLQGNLR